MIVNELKSGNMLTKALAPAKTMGKAKGQARGATSSKSPPDNAIQASTKTEMVSKHRHGEYR